MNERLSPWHRPGAQQLQTLLGGDPAADTVLTRIVEQLGLDETAALAGLMRIAIKEALHDGAHTGREECLHAIEQLINEVEGRQP